MRLQPLTDKIVVLPAPAKDTSDGGIVLPDQAKHKPTRGTVVAVGPGKTLTSGVLIPMSVAPGDEILYSTYSGSDVEHEGLTYKIMHEDDVLSKILPATEGKKKGK